MKVSLITVVALATVIIVNAADPECLLRKKSGLDSRWANPEDCGRFYRCSRGIKREIICPNSGEYDAVSGKCVSAGKGTCKRIAVMAATTTADKDVCVNAASGQSLPNTAGVCREFYICNGDVALIQNCDSGSYFDDSKNACVPDPNKTCWQNYCIDEDNSKTFADSTDCTKYYSCSNNETVLVECGSGQYYNGAECALDKNQNQCWINYCLNQKDGALFSDASNEHAYYECSNEKSILKSCGEQFYDASSEQCVDAVATVEPIETETTTTCAVETITTTTTPCATTTQCVTETTTACSTAAEAGEASNLDCIDGVKDGHFKADPNNCMKFFICSNGEFYDYSCGEGNYFDEETHVCEQDVNGVCPACQRSARNRRSVNDELTCPGGLTQGEFSASADCSKYNICNNGVLVEGLCEYGNLFDSCTNACIPDTNHTCWPYNPCQNKSDDTLVADPKQCNQYLICKNETGTVGICENGDYFNATLGYCVPDTELICSNPCATIPGIKFLPYALDCKKFYFCNAGVAHIETCTIGFFDVNRGLCLNNAVCSTNVCEGKPEGTTLPIANNTKEFTVCLNGVPTNRTCPNDRIFNATLNVCLVTASNNCDQNVCNSTGVGAFSTIDNNPLLFCFCKNDSAYEYSCPSNYSFNAQRGSCYSNAPCDPDFCIGQTEYNITINRNDTHSFCMCVSQEPVTVKCPQNGLFNPYKGNQGECIPNVASDVS